MCTQFVCTGEFAIVYKGYFTCHNNKELVAIKTLKGKTLIIHYTIMNKTFLVLYLKSNLRACMSHSHKKESRHI